MGWHQGPAGTHQTGPWPEGAIPGQGQSSERRLGGARSPAWIPCKLSPEWRPKGQSPAEVWGVRPQPAFRAVKTPVRVWSRACSRGWVCAGPCPVGAGVQRLPRRPQKVICPLRACVSGKTTRGVGVEGCRQPGTWMPRGHPLGLSTPGVAVLGEPLLCGGPGQVPSAVFPPGDSPSAHPHRCLAR